MTFSLTTKASGIYNGGSFGYGFADASGGQGQGPFYVAHVVLNTAQVIIDPATSEGQASALTELQAIAGATAAGSTATNQAAANTLLTQIVALLQQTAAETLWTDNTGAYFIRVDNPAGGAPTWKDVNGAASPGPGAGAKPAEDRTAPVTDKTAYQAISAAGTTIAAGDFIDHFVTTDSVTGAIVGQFWLNSTQGAILAAAPATSNLTALSLLPQGAATLAEQQAIAGVLQQILTALGTILTVKDAALETTIGTTTDAATASGVATTAIGALRAIRDKLLGTVAVSPVRGTSTDVSVTSVASTSAVLIPARPTGLAWTMQAPQSADVWLNPTGGQAGMGLTGCFRVPAGMSAGSSKGAIETNAITYWCATAGLVVPATVL